MRLREAEDKHFAAATNAAASSATLASKQAEIEARHRADMAAVTTACRAREAESEAAMAKVVESKVEQTKTKYEQKLSKLYRQLSEREAYENKLKAIIENEVDVLHQCKKDAEDSDRRAFKKAERHVVEDYVVDRMKNM